MSDEFLGPLMYPFNIGKWPSHRYLATKRNQGPLQKANLYPEIVMDSTSHLLVPRSSTQKKKKVHHVGRSLSRGKRVTDKRACRHYAHAGNLAKLLTMRNLCHSKIMSACCSVLPLC